MAQAAGSDLLLPCRGQTRPFSQELMQLQVKMCDTWEEVSYKKYE